jgi:hypothetical protein
MWVRDCQHRLWTCERARVNGMCLYIHARISKSRRLCSWRMAHRMLRLVMQSVAQWVLFKSVVGGHMEAPTIANSSVSRTANPTAPRNGTGHTACHHFMMHRCVKRTNESMHASHTYSLLLCNLCHALRTQQHRQRHCMAAATLPSLQSVKRTNERACSVHACTHSLLL